MIAQLRGTIVSKDTDGAVLDVNGVGYEVFLPLSTLASLPPLNEETLLWIHTHVREEELRLFGFSSQRDRKAFRTLLKINGVGPKLALTVLGALDGPALLEIIRNGDTRRLSAIPGIGKKTAERMILELGGRLDLGPGSDEVDAVGTVFSELESALVNLGFKLQNVQKVISEVQREYPGEESFAALLRQCLSLLQGQGR